jgi:hypothetical protein
MSMYYGNGLYSTTSSSVPSAWRTSRISEELPVRPDKLFPSVPSLVSNVRVHCGVFLIVVYSGNMVGVRGKFVELGGSLVALSAARVTSQRYEEDMRERADRILCLEKVKRRSNPKAEGKRSHPVSGQRLGYARPLAVETRRSE